MTRIGVVTEQGSETRVAATPATVKQLIGLGYEVVVEAGAGAQSSFPDDAYAAVGAGIVSREAAFASPTVLKVNAPTPEEMALLQPGTTVVSLLSPALRPDLLEALAARGVTALALDAVPRISRAQSMDVLSSMANISGYRAVVEAAHEFGRFFTGQVTAAGKVPPAKVLVAGAGVAGLAAIGAASSLGAIVRATDPRPEVADQVKSIGGEYLKVEVAVEQSTDGYAKATSEAYDRRAAEIYSEQARDVDIVITTALIPGRPAPRLITAADVASMKPGSVIVDMAAGQGGNVEGSVAGERIVTPNGVIILGYTDLASRLPAQASQLYGTNLVNLVKLLTPGKDGQLTIDFDDIVQRSVTVVRDGQVTWPPPPVQVSAAPTPAKVATDGAGATSAAPKRTRTLTRGGRIALIAAGIAALFVVNSIAPDPLPQHFTVLALSIVIGFYVIGKVAHALHTPLMSVTNAISGIIIVGAIVQVTSDVPAVQVLSAIAILLASINIFGGFAVTRRMLGMFAKGDRTSS
ncbi:NAD(P) transhydrogenase subunit alpha [Agromyces flavus]|uniref:NAD(P) transhydrogenase subunit alpha n=1 Tax=Agromyces flavus TaxID=589382 RepID=A0A1H1YYR9_9MICO|nr:Re/Si-specific NAD(P)(+) transhydrogenase subunit alpha [Agromyces flavus]MCP2366856.1 NAD(P) transhydrogenase subunit alpha [Agromyces flavus]GGI46884.1 NAD(P) transhydrogenase subunit alpha [Agromyces flavus]SDT26611.1 NAD(P) transhydrogenase subunit alpha [Agromyces flavus]